MSKADHQYDVCLSFAAEQRNYVNEVANLLTSRGVRVFYDAYEQANLWGKDLYEHLDEVYRQRSKFCIIFISQEYARRVWTTHERRSAQARAIKESHEYILPARFDNTEVPGIWSTIGYIDLHKTSPEELAELTIEKLSTHENEARYTSRQQIVTVPETQSQQDKLLQTKPPAWEYLLFGSVLFQGKKSLESKRRDHHLRYPEWRRTWENEEDACSYISERKSVALSRIDGIMTVITERSQTWAFGVPGEPGDADNIIHLGLRFIRSYESFLDWAAEVRGTSPPNTVEKCYELFSRMLDTPIEQIESFIDEYVRIARTIPELLENKQEEEPIELNLQLILTTDDQLVEDFNREHRRALRRVRKS